MKLSNKLTNISSYPFHMPGHKRNKKFDIYASDIDITEINGFDDLHNPSGLIKELEEDIAKLFSAKRSIISVNGSSCCILSAISAVCNKGDEIIIARNCHKSVYNACYINELDVHYVQCEFDDTFGVYTNVTQKSLDEVIAKYPNSKAVVITSPTYEGIFSNVTSPIPLIVDSAHGAHFGFADWLPKRSKADIVIQSFHKTLPCLTQTAAVHINNLKFEQSIKKYMDIFETSSPSYVLLNSVDKCVDYLKNCQNDFDTLKKMLDNFYSETAKLKNIKILNNDDKTRIVISADGYTGAELCEILRQNGIEAEGATLNYVILISTLADTKSGFELLLKALKSIKISTDDKKFLKEIEIPQKYCKSSEITAYKKTPLRDCDGCVSACDVFAYPPGVPIIACGEIINRQIIDYIELCIDCGVNIISSSNLPCDILLTKE